MFSYNDFLYSVKEGLPKYLAPEYSDVEIEVMDTDAKINTPYRGISISCKDSNIGVCMDLNWLYETLMEEDEVDETIEHIAVMAKEALDSRPTILPEIVENADTFRDHLIPRLVNRQLYASMMDIIPHIVYDDMLITYSLVTVLPNKEVYGTVVTLDMIESLEVPEESLYGIAMDNARRRFPLQIAGSEFMPGQIFVATVLGCIGGASAMLYPGFAEAALSAVGGSFFILPVATDCLYLFRDGGELPKEKREGIMELLVDLYHQDRDFLTDTVYYCDEKTGKITRLGDHVN